MTLTVNRVQLIQSPFEKVIDAAVFQQPETEATIGQQERDVHDADLMRTRVQIQPPARLASALHGDSTLRCVVRKDPIS
jgi:hypothetical protein